MTEPAAQNLSDARAPYVVDGRCPSVPLVTDADFEQTVLGRHDRRRAVVVAFVADASPDLHAQLVMLEIVARSGREIVRLHADALHSRGVAERFAIQSSPTLALFVGGQLKSVFTGDRSVEAIETWIDRLAGPAATAPRPEHQSDRAPAVPEADP